jgi:excisionase family DNA binding protein
MNDNVHEAGLKMKTLLSAKETADELAIGLTKTWELLKRGELQSVRIGTRTLIVGESVAAYVDRLRSKAV